jgi:uncharacterized protein (TIRG00374 family)
MKAKMSTSSVRLPERPSFRALLWWLLLLAAAVTLALNTSEIKPIVDVFTRAQPRYLLPLLLVEALFVINMGLFYASTFHAAGLHADRKRFIMISAAGHFINLVSKSSGFGGLALYLGEGRSHGDSPVKVTAAYMAAYALGYASFLAILIIALVMLYLRGSLTLTEEVASAILFVFIIMVSLLMLSGLRSERALARFLFALFTPVNFASRLIIKRRLLSARKVRAWAQELHETVHFMLQRRAHFLIPAVHALGVELLSIAALYFVALALDANIGLELATAGYALSLLFAILSITPAGLGFVEASLVVFLASTGLTRHEALAVTLGYRLFDFWLPVLVGALCALYLRLPRKEAVT